MSAALKAAIAARRAEARSRSASPTKPSRDSQDHRPSFADELDPSIASPFGSPKPKARNLDSSPTPDTPVEGIQMSQKSIQAIVQKSIENGRVNLSSRVPSLTEIPVELLTLLADEPPSWFLEIPDDQRGPWYAREELHTLQLGNNELRHVDSRISEFRGLKRLEIHNNRITILPQPIFQLTSLTTLTLSNNGLASFPTCLLALDSLVSLNLSHNKIETLWDDDAVAKARAEREAWDKEHSGSDGFMSGFSSAKKASRNDKPADGVDKATPMWSLQSLDLSNNRIGNAALGLPDLASKRSKDAGSGDIVPIRFPPKVQKLDLGNNHLRGPVSLAAFAKLSKLEDLGLQGSGIADDAFHLDEGSLGGQAGVLNELKVLDLSGCEIDDLTKLEAFFGSRRIQTLESDMSVDGVAKVNGEVSDPAKGIAAHQLVRVANRPAREDISKFSQRNKCNALCVILDGNPLREEAFRQKRGTRSSTSPQKKGAPTADAIARDPAIAAIGESSPAANSPATPVKSGIIKEEWELLAEAGLNTEAGRRKHRIEQARKEAANAAAVWPGQETAGGDDARGRTGGRRGMDGVNKTGLSDWDGEPSPLRPGRSSRERASSQQRSSTEEAVDKDGGSALANAKLSTKKKEALGQVPCKFFRSNGCSAGASCPFAHTLPGDGGQKAVCQWFLKGNCRFGHKCALAHVLPGQPMSMDRKNKRAAQHGQPLPQMPGPSGVSGSPAATQGPNKSQHGNAGQQQSLRVQEESQQMRAQPQIRNRVTSFSNKDHDFPFGLPDDMQAISPPSSANRPGMDTFGSQMGGADQLRGSKDGQPRSSLLSELTSGGSFSSIQRPLSVPQGPGASVGSLSMDRSGMSVDGQTIGSPPSSRAFGTSPFSHPGGHSLFFSGSQDSEGGAGPFARQPRDIGFGARSMGRMDDLASRNKWWNSLGGGGAEEDVDDAEDGGAEDFLPSSLSDLLTPAELERRKRHSIMSASLGSKEDRVTAQSMPTHTSSQSSIFDSNMRNGRLPVGAERGQRDVAKTSNISTGFLQRKEAGVKEGQSGYQPFGDGRFSSGLDGIAIRDASSVSQSPGSRAALHHAPGQSLPQGLAAGLSRLHLVSGRGTNDMGQFGGSGQLGGVSVGSVSQHAQAGGLRPPGSVGDYDLGPTAPSSVLPHRSPLAMAIGGGSGRISGAFGSPGPIGSGSPFSPPSSLGTQRRGEGMAIPSGDGDGSKLQPQPIGSYGSRSGGYHIGSHPGMQRVRASSSAAPHSPLTLPEVPREEDEEEAIFELE